MSRGRPSAQSRETESLFSYIRLTASDMQVRDIYFASDIPAGVRSEYNITKAEGFNITFYVSKIYHSVEDGISLKTSDFTEVQIISKTA